ncbi:MAG: uracil-DNA glycosylase [Terracidiphilus sp.]
MATASPLDALNSRIIVCHRCPRLRAHAAEMARLRRRAYLNCVYWGRPVPSFGDPLARVLALGLAPGAHGSNRTGRPFTGDGSGDFLYSVLHETGFASQSRATSRNDGMRLTDLWISAVVRCAPPANRPTRHELHNCASWLDEEIPLLAHLRVVVCLGKIAFDGLMDYAVRNGQLPSRSGFSFAHGAEFALPEGFSVLASYHPSPQNTSTGRLTRSMFLEIFQRAQRLAEAAPEPHSGRPSISPAR